MTAKEAMVAHPEPMVLRKKASRIPRSMAPITAPVRLPSPPITEAMKPFTTRLPNVEVRVYLMPRKHPASPPKIPDITKTTWIMRVALIPMSWAVSLSKETALIALPMLVFWIISASTTRAATLMTSMIMFSLETTAPRMSTDDSLKKFG